MDVVAALDRVPRIPLGHWPTPLESLPRLTAHLGGPPLWVKRDDCSGLGLGGNKVRKLEYLLGEARAQGATRIVTVGGVQSNHARQTAAACARLGLDCTLVLPRMVARRDETYESGGNILLDRLFGAEVHVVADAQAAATRVLELLATSEQAGVHAAFFPAGGSTATGALGYVRAAVEIVAQVGTATAPGATSGARDRIEAGFVRQVRAATAPGATSGTDRPPAVSTGRIVLAVSTAGTLAGLVCGLHALGAELTTTAIAVAGAASETAATALALATEAAALLGVAPPSASRIDVRDGFLGKAYGEPTEAMHEALETCARLEGLVLDPVYSGKAMAGLFAAVRSGEFSAETPIIFLHTGGTPALFV